MCFALNVFASNMCCQFLNHQLLDDVTFLLASGLATFLPKLLQNQYSLTESQAKGSPCLHSLTTLLLPFVFVNFID
jgi:hypothetical protein